MNLYIKKLEKAQKVHFFGKRDFHLRNKKCFILFLIFEGREISYLIRNLIEREEKIEFS